MSRLYYYKNTRYFDTMFIFREIFYIKRRKFIYKEEKLSFFHERNPIFWDL